MFFADSNPFALLSLTCCLNNLKTSESAQTVQDPEKDAVKDDGKPKDEPASDPNLVGWDGPDDPENPHNMPLWRKWLLTMTMSSMTMWMTFASSVFSTATTVTAEEFNVSTEVMTLATSLVVFGFAVGPLLWSPLSELYGRRLPLFLGYTIFAIFQIPVAVAQNLETILVCRFFVGVFGCSPVAVVGGALADFWDPVDRAVAIAMFSAATFVGPALGKFTLLLTLWSSWSDSHRSHCRWFHYPIVPRLAVDCLDNLDRFGCFWYLWSIRHS